MKSSIKAFLFALLLLIQQCPASGTKLVPPLKQCPASIEQPVASGQPVLIKQPVASGQPVLIEQPVAIEQWKVSVATVLATLMAIIARNYLPTCVWTGSISLLCHIGKALLVLLMLLASCVTHCGRNLRNMWVRTTCWARGTVAIMLTVNLGSLVAASMLWQNLTVSPAITEEMTKSITKLSVGMTMVLTANFTVFVFLIGTALWRGLVKTVKTVKVISRPLSVMEESDFRMSRQEREKGLALRMRMHGY